mmetsp:Transcript_11787/g.17860  ORF Transcript_11787/g.17860 Transcript_11787/m.17860 type:complete len:126 (-) Transcript_11787:237-614(-)
MVDIDVIDWDEAMEQCGGDEEFLIELLGDLQEELETQVRKIGVALLDPVKLMAIRSAAHVVKGAAANLMCEDLRSTSADLEQVAKHYTDKPIDSEVKGVLESKYEKLKEATEKYKDFVKTIPVDN